MKKGFTLIELIVIVAIIGLLISVVLLAFNTAKDKSKLDKDPEAYCKKEGLELKVSDLPAICLKYFK